MAADYVLGREDHSETQMANNNLDGNLGQRVEMSSWCSSETSQISIMLHYF